jgi:L-threonylcarbamoyladenylate synthase
VILPFQTDAEITAAIPQVGRHLRADKLLAYTTDTVYGLGSAPTVAAVEALSGLKGRAPG